MGLYNTFKTDAKIEQQGVWLEYDGFRVRIARAGGANKRYLRLLELKTKPVRRAIDTKTLSNERANAIMHEVYAETVVLDWETEVEGKWAKGIEQPDGSIAKFTPKAVMQVFKDLPDLFMDIQAQAQEQSIWRAELQKEEAGNS